MLNNTDALIDWAFGVLFAVFAWIIKRHAARFDKIEDCYVSDTQLEKAIKGVHEAIDSKHALNVRTLERIEAAQDKILSKMDENEERASHTRHEIRDHVNALSTTVAVLNAQEAARREANQITTAATAAAHAAQIAARAVGKQSPP
jgi:predicted DsbA family dithiol-disulfide isomerase